VIFLAREAGDSFFLLNFLLHLYGGCRRIVCTAVAVRMQEVRMTDSVPSLGDLEIRVLRLVWEHQPCTERQISELIMPELGVARTTILKTMQRLEAKTLLTRVPGSAPVQFKAAVERQRFLSGLISQFVETVLGGATDPLMAYLAGQERLSSKDVESLRSIARKIDKNEGAK